MKLEVGKRYVMRNGNKTGPLKQDGITFYGRDTTEDAMRTWGQHGEWYYYHDRTEEDADAYDIVAEYSEPEPAHIADTGKMVEPMPQQPLRWVENCVPDKPGIWACLTEREYKEISIHDVNESEVKSGYLVATTRCYLGPIPEILPPVKKVVERLYMKQVTENRRDVIRAMFEAVWIAEGEAIDADWIHTSETREREI